MILKFLPGVFFTGILFLTQPVKAQQPGLPAANRLGISLNPQHLLVNGLVLDLEKYIKPNGSQSVSMSPRFYYGGIRTVDYFSGRNQTEEDLAYTGKPASMRGAGVEILHRIYRKNQDKKNQAAYFAYGLNYHHFDIDFHAKGWLQEKGPDNLIYLVYKAGDFRETIDRLGLVGVVGLKSDLGQSRFFTDIYSGLGYRHSFITTNYPVHRFDRSILDFGDSGIYLSAGFKIGRYL